MGAVAAMQAVSVVTSVMGAVQSIRQGQAAESQYQVKAAQERAQAERAAVNAEIEGNNVLRKLRETNSTAVARGFAGGVSGFSGSAKLVQTVNETYAGKDFTRLQTTAKERRAFGDIQAQMFEEAGTAARESSKFDALTKLSTAAINTYALMPGGSSGSTGGSSDSSYGMPDSDTPRYGSTEFWKGTT